VCPHFQYLDSNKIKRCVTLMNEIFHKCVTVMVFHTCHTMSHFGMRYVYVYGVSHLDYRNLHISTDLCIHIHTYINIYKYSYIVYIVYMHTYNVNRFTYTQTYIYEYVHVFIYSYIHTNIYVHGYIYTYIYTYICTRAVTFSMYVCYARTQTYKHKVPIP